MSLFGGMPFPVQFFLAFVIVLGLIGATAWAVRRFGAGAAWRRGNARPPTAARGGRLRQRRRTPPPLSGPPRQRRAFGDDRRTDRHCRRIQYRARHARRRARSLSPGRPPASSRRHRAPFRCQTAPANGSWPLQPEPAAPARARRALPRSEPSPEEPAAMAVAAARRGASRARHRDTLAALADELYRPRPPRRRANRPQARTARNRAEPRQEPRQEPSTTPNHGKSRSTAVAAACFRGCCGRGRSKPRRNGAAA